MVYPTPRGEAARYLVDRHRVSVRRACDCVEVARSAYYTESVSWLVRESQTHLSSVSGHETQLMSCCPAAATEAGASAAVCAASAGLRLVFRLHVRCAGLWPAVPVVQYRG